jgi:putative oxidoreductase
MALGRFLVRVLIGLLFVGHGTQKLFGWFGGGGLDETAGGFESMGLKPGRPMAAATGATEAGAGTLLALGLATPLAAGSLIAVMLAAIRTVHFRNGVWVAEGGFEYNAVLIGALALLAEAGPGRASLDAALGIERSGVGWGIAALAGGVLASDAMLRVARSSPADVRPVERVSAEETVVAAGTDRG